MQLAQWNKVGFGNIRHETKELNDKICELQRRIITVEVKEDIEELRDRLENMGKREEILWKQRAKALWLKEGDCNMSFFHAKTNERRLRKEIKRIKDAFGVEGNDKEGIQTVILQYFRSIFATTNPTQEAMKEVLESLECRVTPAMNEALLQPFTSEEISLDLKQMHPLKFLGPDEVFSGMIRKAEREGFGLGYQSEKLAIVFSRNVEKIRPIELASVLGITVLAKHEKYLGLPTVARRSKRELFESLKDRIWHKLHC
ncbi:UNVERIFIED_CONTAM: hypothetical protein Slati_3827100 [Sesamum latifolium]|uniref:Uncharacterized protein n=1 Tax=Sesamum latifolium TaxID=2727402 RepID=A0AAW2TKM0_9LAMI